ncbi:DUF4369 domain-containing protein [Aureibaculum sp. A20]|uniref:DUF4369 domain-containing protein n=1 Tax=Aureibaculum flavum TaxID=2795986 RepID=A0ABS0WKY6_9FLAO|nr:DUF4369 domain-containing protein [Aureibaculum flavum]MBJ2172632.1 DUF4369 domain-containing protein [Aureibaculum flavum]
MKYLILIITLMCSFISCDKNEPKKNDNSFFILGQFDSISDNTRVFLKFQASNNIIPLDTVYTLNNTFQFSGKITKPEVFGIYIDSIKGSIGLFIQNDSVFIEVDKNWLSNSIIKGSQLNDKYLNFTTKSNEIISKTNYLFPLFQKARTENDVDKLKEINKKIDAIYKENETFTLNFAKENSNSYIAAFALQTVLKSNSVKKDSIAIIYNNFSNSVKKGDFALQILIYLDSVKAISNLSDSN